MKKQFRIMGLQRTLFISLIITTLGTVTCLFLFPNNLYPQSHGNKFGLGFKVGGQRFYGDRANVGIGIGLEGTFSYKIFSFADMALDFGYKELKYRQAATNNKTNIWNAAIKWDFAMIPHRTFSPYLSLGAGLLNSKVENSDRDRFWNAEFFGGGGFKLRLSSKLDWSIGATYRFTTGDAFDSRTLPSVDGSNDRYLSVLQGITYYFGGKEIEPRRILASEKAPFQELDEDPELTKKQSKPEYILGFGDVIEIKFFRNPEFNETVTVRPDDRISLQKIGELDVAGMTPSQLDSLITATYSKFVLEPEVTVIVREFGGQNVYVLGEVESPGGYPVERDMSLLQALAVAGGPTNSAKLGSVLVLRRDQDKRGHAIKVDLVKPLKGKSQLAIAQNNIVIQPYDIVYVPKTPIANAADFMTKIYDVFLPPVDLYLRALWLSDRR